MSSEDPAVETSSVESDGQDESTNVERRPAFVAALRIWPAVLVILAIWGLRNLDVLIDEPSMNQMMARFMGPGALSALVLAWWVFFSRALWKEKLIGGVGLLSIAAVAILLEDKTVYGFGTIIFTIPWGATAFALGAICFYRSTPARLVVPLLAAMVGFGYWSLVRTDAIHGDFKTVHRWRWEKTPEDRFLETLESRTPISEPELNSLATEPIVDPEWSAFRGPNRDGVMPNVAIDENWKDHPPQEIWRTKIGPGWSSFSVAGKRLFTQEQRGEREAIVCYNADSGKEVWVHQDESRFWETIGGAGPRATPTIAGADLFALGANGILNRLDPLTGKVVWQRKLREDADRKPPVWGFSSSPLVTDDLVIVHAGGPDDKGVLAYDRESGEPRWNAKSGNHSYSSPQLSVVDGKECVLMLTNDGLTFIEPSDGAILGEYEWIYEGYRVVQPLVLDGSKVLIGTAMGTGTECVNASWDGSKFVTDRAWASKRMNPSFNDYVQHKGFLYGFDNNIFACIDLADGQRKWKRGRYGHGQVLLLPAKDQLLVISEDGELVLLSATPEKHTERARFQVFDARTWNHPVVIGNRLYVRNAQEAACYELK